MQVQSTQPNLPATRNSLHEQERVLTAQINGLVRKANRNILALKDGLKSISNNCARFDAGHRTACRTLLDRRETLRECLNSVKTLLPDQALRLKTDHDGGARIVTLESRSSFKQLFGIGSASREQQAESLATRLGLTGPRVLKKDIDGVLKKAESEVFAAMSKQVEQRLPQLAEHLGKVLGNACIPDSAVIAKQYAASMKEVVCMQKDFDSIVPALLKRVQPQLKAQLKDKIAPLKAQRGDVKSKIESLDQARREQEVAARSKMVRDAGIDLPKLFRLGSSLNSLTDKMRFGDIYHTNAGCEAITSMFDGTTQSVSGSAVIREIQRVHGDDTFTRGAKNEKHALIYAASQFKPSSLKDISRAAHARGVTEYASGLRDLDTAYRRAEHSQDMITKLKNMAGTHKLINPTRFMSTAVVQEDTKKYPVKPRDGSIVEFEILGFSSMITGSKWGMRGEGQERLYSDQSCFKVISAAQGPGGVWQVKLKEVVASDAQRKCAEALKY